MPNITIYHNPRCGTCRQTLEIIRSCGHEPKIVDYLKNPPSLSTLDSLLTAMGKEPLAVTRTREALFKDLGYCIDDSRSRIEWLKILVTNPSLIQRPIVVSGNEVVLARPPENVLDILPSNGSAQ